MANKWNLDGVSVDTLNNMTASGSITAGGVIAPKAYTVATKPTVVVGAMIYVSDGAAGSPIIAFGAGTKWLRCDTQAEIASS